MTFIFFTLGRYDQKGIAVNVTEKHRKSGDVLWISFQGISQQNKTEVLLLGASSCSF